MILVTTDFVSGKELETIGMVKGSTVQTVNAFKDIGAAFKNLVGEELESYTSMMNNARALATKRMVLEAEGMKADAVIGIKYASAAITQAAAEVIAYGTAVRFK